MLVCVSPIQQGISSRGTQADNLRLRLIFMERLFKFLDSKPTMDLTVSNKNIPKAIASGIVFDNVSFAYPDGRLALDQVSFTLKSGNVTLLK
jgi:ATP-binding cassette subfamily B protein